MEKRFITSTLEEDLAQLGILDESCKGKKNEACKKKVEDDSEDDTMDDSEGDSCDDSGDDSEDDSDDEEGDMEEAKKKVAAKKADTKIKAAKVVKGAKAKDVAESEDDAIDGPMVTKELFARIRALPFDNMVAEDFEELLSELGEKEVPDSDDGLIEEAKDIIGLLKEGAATRTRRFKAGGTSKKTSFMCPQGYRAVKVGKGGGRPKCVPSHIAAGGMGKLNKQAREKRKWSKSGAGGMSAMRSARAEKRRAGLGGGKTEDFSPLALELMSINESDNVTESTDRENIINRVANIFELLSEEFMDSTVSDLYEDAMSNMLEMHSAGRLDEDVANEDEFIAAIKPTIALITKSFEKIEGGLGNE